MKTLLLPLLLAAGTAYGALAPATGNQLLDYSNWFEPFRVASDANVAGIPKPRTNFPNAYQADNAFRDWSGFLPNWGGTGLTEPSLPGAGPVTVEIVFLGESSGWWNDLGYRLNGVDHLLADGLQATAGRNVLFGDHTFLTLGAGDSLDFFVTGSSVKKQDGAITVGGTGGQYFAYDKSLNTGGSTQQSYYGTLSPLASLRGGADLSTYYVLGFEDTRVTTGRSDRDYNDVFFAFRYLTATPVPEPATLGVLGAALLLGLVEWRRRTRAA